MICKSIAMHDVARRIERAALADCPVLIWGEAGSGKRFVAQTIHRRSRRGGGPWVIVPSPDAGTKGAPGPTAEVELFGTADRPGKLALAEGGTLLIEEITRLPRTVQAKLLHVMEGRRLFTPEDAARASIDFRLVATTRGDPAESVRRGTLREDLRYHLGVVTIHLPPLRERRDDIPDLILRLLAQMSSEAGTPVPRVEPQLMQFAADHPWPGNVAQLRDCIEIMVRESDAPTLSSQHLRAALAENGAPFRGAPSNEQVATLAGLERAAVLHALEIHEGNRTRAARSLGISVRTLQRKLRNWKS